MSSSISKWSLRSSSSSSSTLLLTTGAVCWTGISVTTLLFRAYRRYHLSNREKHISKEGGLLPQVSNVVEALEWRANHHGSRSKALQGCNSNHNDDDSYTWAEYYMAVQQFARALKQLENDSNHTTNNHRHGVAIHAFNEPNWFISALGALAAGWTVSGIYLTNSYDQAAHVLRTSDVRVLVIEHVNMVVLEGRGVYYEQLFRDFPDLTVVYLHGQTTTAVAMKQMISFDEFLSKNGNKEIELTKPCDLSGDAVASLVYTSGTTDNPKAVELTHDSIHSVCAMMHARIPLNEKTKVVSYLPLSHIAAMGIDLFSSLYCGATVYFADAQALKGSLKETLLRVRPTLFFGVPRVWEKMAAAMQAAAHKSYSKKGSGAILKLIGSAAKFTGQSWYRADTPEVVRCFVWTVPFFFFKTIAFRKVRKACGLDRCSFLYTGAAPLNVNVLNYLRSVDMPLLEVFGMSESNGAIAVCGPYLDTIRPVGACGRALPNGELSLSSMETAATTTPAAADHHHGEILWKGPNNMKGYKGLTAATAATLDKTTGQLHTGDIGRIDSATGYLFITGRKKDIIITAGGENVAPAPIEEILKSLLGPGAGHVVLIGENKKFLSLLIAPPEEVVSSSPLTPEQIDTALEQYNTSYAKSRAQKIQKACVVDKPFTVMTKELTPTMKVKRVVVEKNFQKDIDSMYSSSSSSTNRLVGYSSSSMSIGSGA